MLQREDGCRHQYSYLLTVAGCFEGSPDGYFRLAEAHVATDQPVHRMQAFHVGLDGFRSYGLVGRIFKHKGRFQLLLHERIGREGKSACLLPFRIEFDQILGDILDFRLGTAFEILPGLAAQAIDFRCFAVTRLELGNAVERMDGNKHHVATGINQFDRFLYPSVQVGFHQTSVLPYSMVDMDHIVAHPHGVQVVDRHLLRSFDLPADTQFMITIEYLMVRIVAVPGFFVNVTFMQ